jgi:hypothetical protein
LNILNCFIFRYSLSSSVAGQWLKIFIGHSLSVACDRKKKTTLIINPIMNRFSLTIMAIYNLLPKLPTPLGSTRFKSQRVWEHEEGKFTTNHSNIDSRSDIGWREASKQGKESAQRRARKKNNIKKEI